MTVAGASGPGGCAVGCVGSSLFSFQLTTKLAIMATRAILAVVMNMIFNLQIRQNLSKVPMVGNLYTF